MPSFFTKLTRSIGRKKDDSRDHSASNLNSTSSPKAVSNNVPATPTKPSPAVSDVSKSPRPSTTSSPYSPKSMRTRVKSEDTVKTTHIASFFRSSSPVNVPKIVDAQAPQLEISLPLSTSVLGPESENATNDEFGVLFGEPNVDYTSLSPEVIGESKLSPVDSLRLVKATSVVIRAQGLETLGLFHPHWLSASRTTQRKLISRFLTSLKSNNFSGFEADLEDSRPHDVAAVLKWGLRHMQLDQGSFGTKASLSPITTNGQWAWYEKFAEQERKASFPTDAFSSIVLPLLPVAHANLLRALLDLFSSVTAHADGNGMFNTKLSKILSWWIVSSRVYNGDSWNEFYAEWERSARILEHIFLCFLRDQSRDPHKLPLRLMELQQPYPPSTGDGDVSGALHLPPKPRLTTRNYTALLVRVQVSTKRRSRERDDPVKLLNFALAAPWNDDQASSSSDADIWLQLKADVTSSADAEDKEIPTDNELASSEPSLTILADTTVRWLSLIQPVSTSVAPPSPLSPLSPASTLGTPTFRRRRSLSLQDAKLTPNGNGLEVLHEHHTPEKAASSANLIPSAFESNDDDWKIFSSAGFGNSPSLSSGGGLAQSLVRPNIGGKYSTPPQARKSFGGASPLKRKPPPRLDLDSKVQVSANQEQDDDTNDVGNIVAPSIVQLDEAFVDTWADTLLDPTIASTWPHFALYQLKKKRGDVEWLIIERAVAPPPPEDVASLENANGASRRPVSPDPSLAPSARTFLSNRRLGSATASGKKRFSSFFGRGSDQTSSTAAPTPAPDVPKRTRTTTLGGEELDAGPADDFGKLVVSENKTNGKVVEDVRLEKEKVKRGPAAAVSIPDPALAAVEAVQPKEDNSKPTPDHEPISPAPEKRADTVEETLLATEPETTASVVPVPISEVPEIDAVEPATIAKEEESVHKPVNAQNHVKTPTVLEQPKTVPIIAPEAIQTAPPATETSKSAHDQVEPENVPVPSSRASVQDDESKTPREEDVPKDAVAATETPDPATSNI